MYGPSIKDIIRVYFIFTFLTIKREKKSVLSPNKIAIKTFLLWFYTDDNGLLEKLSEIKEKIILKFDS